jgi:hypothetical protein
VTNISYIFRSIISSTILTNYTKMTITRWISVTDFFRSNLPSLLLFVHTTDCCRTNGRVPPSEWRKFYKRGPSEVQFVLFYYLTEHCNILTEQIDQVCPFGYNGSYISLRDNDANQARDTNKLISSSKIIDNVEWMLKKLYVYMEQIHIGNNTQNFIT